MAQKKRKSNRRATFVDQILRPFFWLRRWLIRILALGFIVYVGLVTAHTFTAPSKTLYMKQEAARLGEIQYRWVALDDVAPEMARSVVAAEDANFCLHWGFDMTAIRQALDDGSGRGASTIPQQTVKNVYLWQGRSWARKAMEALMTPIVEALWSKRRIMEVYLNIAEYDEGVFGVAAAAQHYFGASAGDLTNIQAARLAAILPDPKGRSASQPSSFVRQRASQILDGAATIARDGRSSCFED
ncbi:MAG: monofunctional biosynthetic peptidoglycan transglycosylase [Pseudomonadota bacterium]